MSNIVEMVNAVLREKRRLESLACILAGLTIGHCIGEILAVLK